MFKTKQKGTDIQRHVEITKNEDIFDLYREDLENKKNDMDFKDYDSKLILGLPSPRLPDQIDYESLKGQEAYENGLEVYRTTS